MKNGIPRLHLQTEQLLRAAEARNIVTMSSDIENVGYAYDEIGVLIITSHNGYILIDEEDIWALTEELQYLAEDIKRRQWLMNLEKE